MNDEDGIPWLTGRERGPGPGQLTRARAALAQQGDLTLDESVG